MSAGIAIILFVSVAIIYITIIDLFTLVFRILGLTQEQARFQVISLLTNSGYTTKEAEIIVEVPSRRHLARTIMLFGSIFSVTFMSLFVSAVTQLPRYEAREVLPFILGTAAGFIIFMIIRRKPNVRRYFDDKIITAAEKRLVGKNTNSVILLDELTDASLSKVIINRVPKDLDNMPISELKLEDKGIHPLYCQKQGEPIQLVNKDTKLIPNFSLTVIGPIKAVRQIFVDSVENEKNNDNKKDKSNANKQNIVKDLEKHIDSISQENEEKQKSDKKDTK